MNRVLACVLLLFCTVPLRPLTAQTNQQGTKATQELEDPRLREFENYVRVQMERDRIPGITIGVLKGDQTWVRAFGYADVENKVPALPNSAYRIASSTKPMTGAAIVQLAERGKINLDAEIQTYLPDYAKQKWPITIRQLLTHLGGGQAGSGLGPDQVSMKELVARISATPITVEPGTRFVYGTGDYNLLAAVVEKVTGGSFEKYLRENLWLPAGMNDTRIDDVRGLVPNRVRGYDLADGELKNAPFVNVSSRIGGGGVTSTVPDMLRWGKALIEQKIVSPKWHEEMLRPVTTTSGRWSGIGDGDQYYTLGWMIRPVNGNFAVNHDGGQKGTASAFFVFPEKRVAISVLSNLEFAPLEKYARKLYETITGEQWIINLTTRDPVLRPIAQAVDSVFNYGSLDYWHHHKPMTADVRELAEAFDYFNANANQDAIRGSFANTSQKIRDGRHPVAGNAFIKVGSYMTAKLVEKNGAGNFASYFKSGGIPFFADYVRLYRADSQLPRQFRFSPAFEKLIERWNADWSRTWNDYTRNVEITPHADFAVIGARLKKEFAEAEVYPDFTADFQKVQQGEAALTANKLGVDLYPTSDELLFNLGYFLIIAEQFDKGEAARKLIGNYERPIVYLQRAFDANPNGVIAAGTFLDLGRRWLRRPEMHGAAIEFVSAGIKLHSKNGALHELLGDLLLKKGQTDAAASKFRLAYQLDPKLAKGASVEEYVAGRLKN